ncbi:hypothetical protein BDZ91DRAFT_790850 [Kalaharituber pfeilii]|nr:hypothetical protein BDZ91DRAFT_790850 [Kalaharituber pfeilii]
MDNRNEEQTLAAIRAAAALALENLSPGERPHQIIPSIPTPPKFGDGGDIDSDGSSNSNGTIPSISKANVSDLVRSVGAIVGGVLGGVLFLALIVGAIIFWTRRRRRAEEMVAISSGKENLGEEGKRRSYKDAKTKKSKSSGSKGGEGYAGEKRVISRPTPIQSGYLTANTNNSRTSIIGVIPIESHTPAII